MKRITLACLFVVFAGHLLFQPPPCAAGESRYRRVLKGPAGREKLASVARMEEAGKIDAAVIGSLLADKEPLIRARCAEALGRIGDPSGVALLTRLIDDRSPLVAKTAIYSLGLIGGESTLEPLKRSLGEQSKTIRAYVLEALGKTGEKGAAPIVSPWLRNFDSSIRAQAALALAFTGDSAAASECDAIIQDPDPRVAASAAYAMGRLGYSDGTDRITELLLRDEGEVKFRAIEALGRLKHESSVPLIAKLTADPDRWVAVKAAEALGRIGSGKGASALEALLASDDVYLRTLGLNGLAVVGSGRHFESVKPLLADKSPMVRRAALGAAAKTLGDKARAILLEAAARGSVRERSTALELLGRIGDKEDLPLIVKALRSERDALIREGAATGLGAWPKPDDLTKPCECEGAPAGSLTPVKALLDAADGDDWVVASIAIESLGKAGLPEVVPDLMRVFEEHDEYNDGDRKLAVVEAVGASARKLGEKEIREFAVAHFLAKAARNADPRVASAAADAAARFRMELTAAPSGGWKRGAFPWTGPVLPLGERKMLIATPRGNIEILLYGDEAPVSVKGIITLAKSGFYDGLSFHRVVPGFVIQGGCPRGDGWGDAGYLLRNEISMHRYERGTVGLADSGKDTAGSQFFITQTAQPHLNGRYVIIGTVTRGMDVVDAIEEGDTFSVKVID